MASLTQTKTTDYVGNKVYENGVIRRILVDGGYIQGNEYHFYQTDHLGNNRAVAKTDGTLVQKTHYYPFGSSFGVATGTSTQPYRYNGKELDQMHGLNLYDYSARYYEAAIGRFTSVDPHAEKYYSISPYAYVGNNPIIRTDPTGMDWYQDNRGNVMWQEGNDKTITRTYEGENGSFTTTYSNVGAYYSTIVCGEDGVDVEVQYNQMDIASTTYADDFSVGGMILSGLGAYSDNYHNHLTYTAGNGEIKNLYKGKNILKPRSALAKDYIRLSNILKGVGHLSNGAMGGIGAYNVWNGSTNPLDYTDAIAGISALTEAAIIRYAGNPLSKTPVGTAVGVYSAGRLSWDVGRLLGPIWGGDAWVRWYRENQREKALIPAVKFK